MHDCIKVIQIHFCGRLRNSNPCVVHKYVDAAEFLNLMEWQESREKNLAAHTKAIQAYAVLLGKISEGHQKLYDGRNDLAKAQLIQQIKQSVKELKNILDAIKKI